MTQILELDCRRCHAPIDDSRSAVATCGPCTWAEMIESRTAPMCSGFEPFVCENLYREPVIVNSSNHFKELQKLAGCVHVGDDGQKANVQRAITRSHENIKRKQELARDIRSGNLPPDFGKKKPFDPALEAAKRKRHDDRPDSGCGSFGPGE